MMIQLRVRCEKLASENRTKRLVNNEFMLFDNCEDVKFGQPQIVNKDDFNKLYPKSIKALRAFETPRNHNNELITELVFMLKDSEVCSEDEKYHYNVIEWTNRVTKRHYQVRYDTMAFILDDSGKTIRKVEG